MNHMTNRFRYSLLIGLIAVACEAHASLVFTTPSGSTLDALPVDAQVTFTPGNGTLGILLENLQANPTSVIQLISDLEFALSILPGGASSISSSSSTEVTVNGDGSFTLGSTVATGWGLTTNGSVFTLDVLGTLIGPAHLIIGPPDGSGNYSNANGSIAGNGPHNPFLDLGAAFTLSIPGITADTQISDVIFSFGTTPNDVTATVPGIPLPQPAPEPATLGLIGLGLAALGLARRRRS